MTKQTALELEPANQEFCLGCDRASGESASHGTEAVLAGSGCV